MCPSPAPSPSGPSVASHDLDGQRTWRDDDGRLMGEIDMMPLHDSVTFRDGVTREDGYRELFALGCKCPPDEIVNLRFFEQGGFPAVGATWRFELGPLPTPTVVRLPSA